MAHHQSLPSRAEPQAPTKMEGEKHLPQVLCCPPCVCKASTSPQDTPSTQIIKFIRLQGYSVSYDGWGICSGAWEDTVFPQAPAWPHISFRPTLPLCNWSCNWSMPTVIVPLLTNQCRRKWQLLLLRETMEGSEPQFSLQCESFYLNFKVLSHLRILISFKDSLKSFSTCTELHVRSILIFPALSNSGNVEYLIPSRQNIPRCVSYIC